MADTAKTAKTAKTPQAATTPNPAKTTKTTKAESTSAQPRAPRPASAGKLRITYVKSVIGSNQKQRDTIKALGLRRLHQSVEHGDTPEIRGMVNRVSHLVRVEEVAG